MSLNELLMLPHVWLTMAAIVLLQGIALYTWQFREEPGARWQAYLQLCKGCWLLSVLLILAAPSAAARDFWQTIYSILAFWACFCWLRYIGQLSGAEREFAPWVLPIARGVVGLFWIMIVTNSWHHWYWSSVTVVGGVAHVHTEWLGYLALVSAYCIAGFSLWINIRWALHSTGLRRRQAWTFVLPSLASWGGQALGYLPHPQELEPHVVGFLTSSILMAWAFHRWRMYSILPLARKVVLSDMIDGLLVVDDSGYIVDMNGPAMSIFAEMKIAIGSRFEQACKAWPMLGKFDGSAVLNDVAHEQDGTMRYYQIKRTPLQAAGNNVLGEVISLRETTHEVEQQQRILEQQQALTMLKERARLGRELHDGPGQMWSFLAAQMQALRIQMERNKPEKCLEMLAQMQSIVKDSYLATRESITSMQSHVAEGLVEAIEEQMRWYRESCGLHVELCVDAGWRDELLGEHEQLQVLRILQEALVNVRKSAAASSVRVEISCEAQRAIFRVVDNGHGFDPDEVERRTGRYGLRIMRERAAEIGAAYRLDASPNAGCRIELAVPCRVTDVDYGTIADAEANA